MRWGLLLGNLTLNVLHGVLWFVCFWLMLRFTVGYSLVFAAIFWGVTTIAVLPMLLDQAATIAQARPTGGEPVAVPEPATP